VTDASDASDAAADATLRNYYARRAPVYDAVYRKPERQAELAQLRERLAPRFAGERVLELACGTGYWTAVIAPAAGTVLALDAAEETLAIARARVALPQLRFVRGDAYDPPPAEPPWSAAFAGFWWSHVPRARLEAFLRALHAVLAPGATVCLLDNRYVPGSSTPISETDADGNTYQQRPLPDGRSVRVLKNFPTPERLQALLRAAGAEDVRYTALAHYWLVDYRVGSFVGP